MWHAAWMRNAYKLMVGEPEGMKPLGRHTDMRIILQ
jgi:hypothetical protein